MIPSDKIWQSTSRITAYFDLNGVDTGKYDVIALLNGGMFDTIKGGFTIEKARPIYVDVNDISGGRSRPNRMRPLIQLQNTGNEDAIMVPVTFMLGHNPEFSNITVTNISENFIDLSGLPFFQDVQPYLTGQYFFIQHQSHGFWLHSKEASIQLYQGKNSIGKFCYNCL